MRTVDMFYILDYDRCLFNSSYFQDAYIRCIADNHHALTREQIQDSQRATEATGGSFDTVSYVRNFLGQTEWLKLKELFLKEVSAPEKRELLYFGEAEAFIERLRGHNIPFGIMTYGGEEWQQMKLQALGFANTPHIITSMKHKARIITSYYNEMTQMFIVPTPLASETLQAAQVCLIDDKAVSFEALPVAACGYWLVPDESQLNIQQKGEVGQNVKKIASLSEITL